MKRPDNHAADAQPVARHIIVGTAGHIDHGKTSLVYALTGTDTDRLPEEKQRGITIDLGFAELTLDGANGEKLSLSLIDVPGHHAFIRNMLAGAGGIDFVLLVIAADDGVKAQTIEHLAICELLGIERGVIALTKCDAVSSDRVREVTDEVRRFAAQTFLHDAAIVPVSAMRAEGISEVTLALAALAADVPPRSRQTVTRLPLDRSFSLRGFGTVVTGTLHSGSIHVGDSLEQQPGGRSVRVRSLQVHGKSQPRAEAPCRVALNLPSVEVEQIGRGDALVTPGTVAPAGIVDVQLEMLAGAPALRHGSRVHVHAFTSETLARVLLFDQKDTHAPGSGFARLKLAESLLLVPGDRLVLRQSSPAATIGGATVLDATPVPRLRKAATLSWLQQLSAADAQQRLLLRAHRRGTSSMSLAGLRRETGLTFETLREQLAPLIASGSILCLADQQHFVSAQAMLEAVQRIEVELEKAGALSRAELRSRSSLSSGVFDAASARLLASGRFELSGEVVRKVGEALPEAKRGNMQAIENFYARAGLAAPLLSDVARQLGLSQPEMRELITLLLREKRLIRLGADDALVHPDALDKLYRQMRVHRGESFDVGRFKSMTGLTRKHAIPLLEHLDQARVTRNNGGTRIVL
jgi:selenocysteine-specific elongation factor